MADLRFGLRRGSAFTVTGQGLPAAARALLALLLAAALSGLAGCEKKIGGLGSEDLWPRGSLEAQLARAAAEGREAEIQRLVAAGARVNAQGLKGVTPLAWAMYNLSPSGMRALLRAGADPNQPASPHREPAPERTDYVLICLAAQARDITYLKILLEFGADPNLPIASADQSALECVVMTDFDRAHRLERYRMLVEAGADVNRGGMFGETSVITALHLRCYELILYALEHGYNRYLPHIAWDTEKLLDFTKDWKGPRLPAHVEELELAAKTLALLKSRGVVPKEGPRPPWSFDPAHDFNREKFVADYRARRAARKGM